MQDSSERQVENEGVEAAKLDDTDDRDMQETKMIAHHEIDTIMEDLREKTNVAAMRSSGHNLSCTGSTLPLSGEKKTALAMNISKAVSIPGAYDSDNVRRTQHHKTSESQFAQIARLRTTQKEREYYQQPDRGLEGCIPDNDDLIDDMQARMNVFDADVTLQNSVDQKRELQKQKLRRILFCVLVLLVVIGAVIGTAVGLTGQEGSSNGTEALAPSSPSIAPRFNLFSTDCAISDSSSQVVTERYTQFRSTIDTAFPNMMAAIDIPLSAHRVALCWIADFDSYQVSGRAQEIVQRFLLTMINFHFLTQSDDHNAEITRGTIGWIMDGAHECDWDHVECGNDHTVLALSLGNANLIGTIPEELSLLTTLIAIDVSSNSLSGEIPPSLHRLTLLQGLRLDANQLSGTLFGNMTSFRDLSGFLVSQNSLTGAIPDFSDMPNLVDFAIGDNPLQGTFPNLSASTGLGEKCCILRLSLYFILLIVSLPIERISEY